MSKETLKQPSRQSILFTCGPTSFAPVQCLCKIQRDESFGTGLGCHCNFTAELADMHIANYCLLFSADIVRIGERKAIYQIELLHDELLFVTISGQLESLFRR